MANKKRLSEISAIMIKQIRGDISQADAAQIIQCSKNTFSNYERGITLMKTSDFTYLKSEIEKLK